MTDISNMRSYFNKRSKEKRASYYLIQLVSTKEHLPRFQAFHEIIITFFLLLSAQDMIDFCSDKERHGKSVFVSSTNYPTPMRGGASNCTCVATSPNGITAVAFDVSFRMSDSDSECEKSLSFDERRDQKVTLGCDRQWSAERQVFQGRAENLTISLINGNKDGGYAWLQLKRKYM